MLRTFRNAILVLQNTANDEQSSHLLLEEEDEEDEEENLCWKLKLK